MVCLELLDQNNPNPLRRLGAKRPQNKGTQY